MTRTRPGSRGSHRHPRCADRGAAAVELALVLPVLLLMLFGIIDIGRMLHAQLTLTEAAREGARAASLGRDAEAQVRAGVDGLVDPHLVDTDPGESCIGAAPGANAIVEVSYPFAPVTPIGSMMAWFGNAEDGSVSLVVTGVMPCLG